MPKMMALSKDSFKVVDQSIHDSGWDVLTNFSVDQNEDVLTYSV